MHLFYALLLFVIGFVLTVFPDLLDMLHGTPVEYESIPGEESEDALAHDIRGLVTGSMRTLVGIPLIILSSIVLFFNRQMLIVSRIKRFILILLVLFLIWGASFYEENAFFMVVYFVPLFVSMLFKVEKNPVLHRDVDSFIKDVEDVVAHLNDELIESKEQIRKNQIELKKIEIEKEYAENIIKGNKDAIKSFLKLDILEVKRHSWFSLIIGFFIGLASSIVAPIISKALNIA